MLSPSVHRYEHDSAEILHDRIREITGKRDRNDCRTKGPWVRLNHGCPRAFRIDIAEPKPHCAHFVDLSGTDKSSTNPAAAFSGRDHEKLYRLAAEKRCPLNCGCEGRTKMPETQLPIRYHDSRGNGGNMVQMIDYRNRNRKIDYRATLRVLIQTFLKIRLGSR